MTSVALILRCFSGFRLIWMRPLFSVVLVPSTPMNDDRLSTAGSLRIPCRELLLPLGHCREGDALVASETPWITPVSCTGKKPFGITM